METNNKKYKIYLCHEYGLFYSICDEVSKDMVVGLTLLISGLTSNEVREFNMFCSKIDSEFNK